MRERLEQLRQHFTLAAKSIRFAPKQYAAFFVSIFIVELFLFVLFLSQNASYGIRLRYETTRYDCHATVYALTSAQAVFLENDEMTVFESEKVYRVVRTRQTAFGSAPLYSVDLQFVGDDLADSERFFRARYLPALGFAEAAEEYYSVNPLFDLLTGPRADLAVFLPLLVLIIGLSLFLLAVLFGIRIRGHRFLYGVYMTFGADLHRLYRTALWEFLLIAFCGMPFALLAALAVLSCLFGFSAALASISPISLLTVLFLAPAVVALALRIPLRAAARRAPVALLRGEDNSGLVSSPRRSERRVTARFPVFYEFLSAWRFRRYYLRLILSVNAFSALFLAGVSVCALCADADALPRAEFTINASADAGLQTDLLDYIATTDGVSAVNASAELLAGQQASFLLLDREHVLPFSHLMACPTDASKILVREAAYRSCNQHTLSFLQGTYEIEGDATSLLTQKRTVLIADSLDNSVVLNIHPGDTVLVAKKTGQRRPADDKLSGDALMTEWLRYYSYEYEAYTVGAVIRGMPCTSLPIYFSDGDYASLVGESPRLTSADVFLSTEAETAQIGFADAELRSAAALYGGAEVVAHHTGEERALSRLLARVPLLMFYALLLLMMAPTALFFSQSIFSSKRDGEFFVLSAMGAPERSLRRAVTGSGLLVGVSLLISSMFSAWAINRLMLLAVNRILPFFTGKPTLRLTAGGVIPALPAGLLIPTAALLLLFTLAAGLLSAILPYRARRRRMERADRLSDPGHVADKQAEQEELS